MSVTLNHTIVHAKDKVVSARFLGAILDVEVGEQWGPFIPVTLANDVTLDYIDADVINPQHYAFLVEESEFDPIFARVQAAGAAFYADPARSEPGVINHHFDGRGVYFDDPDGHLMEVITQPYA